MEMYGILTRNVSRCLAPPINDVQVSKESKSKLRPTIKLYQTF